MGRNGTTGASNIDIIKFLIFFYLCLDHCNGFFRDTGMGNKDPVGTNIGTAVQLIFDVLLQALIQCSPIFLTNAHLTAGIIHFDTRFEL